MNNPQETELEELFKNMPSETDMAVELPSRGKFYSGFGGAVVQPLLFEDEQKILMSKNSNIDPINQIIAKCVKGVNVSELIQSDKEFLLLKIKEVSYGPNYNFEVICPKCTKNSLTTLDVSKLTVNYAEDSLTDPREIYLPMLKVRAVVKFPRVRDEALISKEDSPIGNIWRFVVSVNGKEDPTFIHKALEKMHIRDLKVISKNISRNDLGVDTRFHFSCPHCQHQEVMSIPFDANFFSVS